MIKLLLFLLIFSGCSIQNDRLRPDLALAFAELDAYMTGVPIVKARAGAPETLVSSEKLDEDIGEEGQYKCYIAQYHLDMTEGTLIINTIYYSNQTEIEVQEVSKFKIKKLTKKFVVKKVNDGNREMPESFYAGYDMYVGARVYLKYEKDGKTEINDETSSEPTYEHGAKFFAIKSDNTHFSALSFPPGSATSEPVELYYNGLENSIDDDLRLYGTTPDQAANIKLGELDIPALFPDESE